MNNKPAFKPSNKDLSGKKVLILSTVWNAEILAPMKKETKKLFHESNFEGFIAIGLVVKGGTPHFKLVCKETYRGLANLAYDFPEIPVINGVLTVENLVQAEERINPDKINKGKEFAQSLIQLMSS